MIDPRLLARETTPEDVAFMEALQGEDDLGCVVRATIYLENFLIQMLELAVANPKHLSKLNLDYDGRVSLSLALGLTTEMGPPLRALGSLRNRFAHRLGMRLAATDAKNLYDNLSSIDRRVVQMIFEHMREVGIFPTKLTFSRCPPRDQFIIVLGVLRRALQVGLEQLQTAKALARPDESTDVR